MIFRSVSTLDPSKSAFILLNKGQALSEIILSDSEKDFVESQLSNEKELVFLQRSRQLLAFCFIKSENNEHKQLETIRKHAATYLKRMFELGQHELSVFHLDNHPEWLFAAGEGAALASYKFTKYCSEKPKEKLEAIELVGADAQLTEELANVVDAVFAARNWVNEPLSYLTAEAYSKELEQAGKTFGFNVEVLDKKKIESLKMGGLLAVNKGAVNPPTFNILEYKPENAVNNKPIILVGKGVVYDTGGLSLKPTPNSMDFMKMDMGGSASVAGAMCAVAKSKLPVHLIVLIPATENRPGGDAYAPGDVITMYSGKTVEVLNTDAEGRMILADALAYAKKYDPLFVLDYATLTGSAMRAIGEEGAVAMGNADERIKDLLSQVGEKMHERIVWFPMWDEYREHIKSQIADITNLGKDTAGSISAGMFLREFTDYPWVHVDIAGPAYLKTDDYYRTAGGTGYGVRQLYAFFKEYAKKNK